METVTSIWSALTAPNKLDRDRGIAKLEVLLSENENDPEVAKYFVNQILASKNENSPWEVKLGTLEAAKTICRCASQDVSTLLLPFTAEAISLLTDEEVRVRTASGEFLGEACRSLGPGIYEECKNRVFGQVRADLDRAFSKNPSPEKPTAGAGIFHDTAGWRNLETSVRCVQSMAAGCGSNFRPYIDQDLLDVVFACLKHENRFVRETGYQTCATIIDACSEQAAAGEEMPNPIYKYSRQLADNLAAGLADNWSQVRMAATVATRQLLMFFKDRESRGDVFDTLLPRLCLNRYYLAEGVRIYSQATWVMVVGRDGRRVVGRMADKVVDYYVDCTGADNHAVRESACQCIAELAGKLEPESVRPHVDRLIRTLIGCFDDESWPVRDTACVAASAFVKLFPQTCRAHLDRLITLFYANLADPIASVRQGGALAVARTVETFIGSDANIGSNAMSRMKKSFDGVKDQPAESQRFGGLENAAEFGVAKRARDNDPELHENRQMYSCGSLGPKMGRGGCGDCTFRKPSEPWEAADGCLYLLAELSAVPACRAAVEKVLPDAAQAARHKHYTMHYTLIETLAKVLPVIAENIGKRSFKPYLEDFFDPVFYACDGDNALAAAAGRTCLFRLAEFIGPNILRGRVEQYNHRYVGLLEECLDGQPPPSSTGFAPAAPGIPIGGAKKPIQPSLGGTPTGSPH